jgi:hypothetical protein
MRIIEEMCYLPLFPPDCDEAHQAYQTLRNSKVMLHRFGFMVVLSELQRLSGESMTSVSNGLINAFVMWLSQGEPSLTNLQCFAEGDDGLVPEIPGVDYVHTATLCGLELTLIPHHNFFTANFCGRFLTQTGSMCDFMRTMSKFHLSSNVGLDRKRLLLAKSLSYLATDYNTPVVGAMCWAFMQKLKGLKPIFTHDYVRRKDLVDIHVSTFYSMPPPVFDRSTAYQITWIHDISFNSLAALHANWVAYGQGRNPRFITIENTPGSNDSSIVFNL